MITTAANTTIAISAAAQRRFVRIRNATKPPMPSMPDVSAFWRSLTSAASANRTDITDEGFDIDRHRFRLAEERRQQVVHGEDDGHQQSRGDADHDVAPDARIAPAAGDEPRPADQAVG